MSDRKEKKHKKKKHKKEKKPRLHERVGYTDDDNPFGDRDLGAAFVWKKKEDQSRKKKRPPPSRDEEDRIEEIEKVRRRRDAREAELAEMERLRDEERRLRDAEQFEDWQAKEEDFHRDQTRLRSLLRLAGGRSRPVDRLARNVLLVELGEKAMKGDEDDYSAAQRCEGDALRALADLDVEVQPPARVLEGLSRGQLEEISTDAREYAAREGSDGKWRDFWRALLVLIDDALEGSDGRALGAVSSDVQSLLRGKTRDELERTALQARQRAEVAQDDSYWRAVARAADRAAATRTLDDAHRELLQRQLVILKWRTEKLRQDPEAANRLRRQDAPAVVQGDIDEAGDELRAREASRGFADDEEQMLASSEVETKDVSGLRKPRYLNRIKTGYERNKDNQAHYTPEEPPAKTVQGYKFNIFYPDLVDPSKPPIYKLEACPGSDDFAILRFKAGPPYRDVAFKIVNQQWESQPKRGFRCVFERGILTLAFNFKRWRYRR